LTASLYQSNAMQTIINLIKYRCSELPNKFNSRKYRQMNLILLKKNNMSKLIYFKRYLYVIDRRSRPCSFIELQEHVMHKLEQDDIDTTFEYAIRTFDTRKTLRPFWDCYSIQPRRQNVYWWRWNRRPVDLNDRCFSIHHALQEGNKLSPSVFLEKRKSLGTEHIYGIIHAIQNLYL
jgi:hypothetical protein